MDSPDTHELDALESLEISEGYRLVMARVQEMIEIRRDAMEQCATNLRGPGSIEYMQGFIAACRTFPELPAILREEIQRQMKEPR